jgi:anthranilate phosphoribosyltransferase
MQITSDVGRLLRRDPALGSREMEHVWGAILDEAVDELEVGAILAALATRGESGMELAALHAAMLARLPAWSPSLAARAIVIPAYGALPGEAAWVALMVALLPRFGLPVIVHGVLDSPCGISAARVLREMGLPPSATFAEAEAQLAAADVAFVPAPLVSRPFARLVALRTRMGIENAAHVVAPALPIVRGAMTRITFEAPGTASERLALLDGVVDTAAVSLAWPSRGTAWQLSARPRVTRLHNGVREVLFDADSAELRAAGVPIAPDAVAMARLAVRIAEGAVPVPVPVLNIVAACLLAGGQAPSLAQAKAVAAIQAGRLAA